MIYIEGSNVLNSQKCYNRNQVLNKHKRKWRVKESHKEHYRTLGEGILFLISLLVPVYVLYLWAL